MTTPDVDGIGAPSVNFGNMAGGTLGTSVLQQSVDTLTNAVNNLSTRLGSLSFGGGGQASNAQAGQGGGPTRVFPGVINPFNNNSNQPGIGGGGPGGTGNVNPPNPFGAGGRVSSIGAFMGAFAGYGQQQLPIQLALNAYATQTALAQGQLSSNFTTQYRQAFGYQNQNLNFMASSPLDAIAGTQGLQYLAGNPTFMGTPIGRAGLGYAAAFANANPLASMQQSVGFAQQITNPQTSLLMMSMGYPVTARRLGGGANLPASVIQGMLRAWYGQKDVNPNTLTAGLGQGGKANLNLQALGINPVSAAPLLEEYNQLFNRGLTTAQAQGLINRSKFGNLATAKTAQERLADLGVQTASSSAQALRNNQALITERDANIASGFSRGLQDATGILQQFNNALTNIMTTLHANGLVGYLGGMAGTFAGTNHGNSLLGIGGGLGLGLGAMRLLGLGGAGGAGGLGGLGGGAAGGLGLAGAAGVLAPIAGGVAGFIGLNKLASMRGAPGRAGQGIQGGLLAGEGNLSGIPALTNFIMSLFGGGSNAGSMTATPHFAGGGIVPGYSPGIDNRVAFVGGGEAILNPGATRELGAWNIHNLNARNRPIGARSGGGAYAAGGIVPAWPFATKSQSQYRRVDQGWDLQYPGTNPTAIYAIESGTLRTAGPDPNGFGISYPLLTLDQAIGRNRQVYYGHTYPDTSKVGKHVARGEEIGHTGGLHSGGNAYADSNWLEIGWWANGPTGAGQSMKNFLLGSKPGGGTGSYGGTTPGSTPTGLGSSTVMGGISGIGYSESSLIPNTSELSSLTGGMVSAMSSLTNPVNGSSTSGSTTTGGSFGSVTGSGGTPAQNRLLMQKLAAVYGWGSGSEWSSLNSLEMSEAGYRQYAQNPNSTAYGIGQFLDSTWAGFGPKTSNPRLQEIYMLEYIKQRYNDPNKAWAFHQANNYYAEGGTITDNIAVVGERGPELLVGAKGSSVINNDRTRRMIGGPHIVMNFGKESVVIRVDHAGSDASSSGRNIARQFIKWLDDETMYTAIGMGSKNGY